jgi:hypothetical protein
MWKPKLWKPNEIILSQNFKSMPKSLEDENFIN